VHSEARGHGTYPFKSSEASLSIGTRNLCEKEAANPIPFGATREPLVMLSAVETSMCNVGRVCKTDIYANRGLQPLLAGTTSSRSYQEAGARSSAGPNDRFPRSLPAQVDPKRALCGVSQSRRSRCIQSIGSASANELARVDCNTPCSSTHHLGDAFWIWSGFSVLLYPPIFPAP
jgi:hypothetical protein